VGKEKDKEVSTPQKGYELLPWLFMLFALPICYLIWQAERNSQMSAGAEAFQWRLNLAEQRLTNQVGTYEQALYGMRSLFDSSEFVSEQEFELFVKEMLRSNFSHGLRQVGFIKLEAQASNQALVSYIASKDQPSHVDVTFNAYQNEAIKNKLVQSASANQAVLSKPIAISQRPDDYAIILPVYAEPVDKQQLSHQSVYGWVFANLDMQAIFNATLSGLPLPNTQIRYVVSDRQSLNSTVKLYENVGQAEYESLFSQQKLLAFNGTKWTLFAQSLRPFEKKVGVAWNAGANKVGLIALFVTAAISSILFLLVGRLRAYEALKQVNKRLKLSDERWHFALEGSGDGVWDWDIENGQVEYSKRWKQIFGYIEDELDGTHDEWERLLHPDDKQLATDTLSAYLNGHSGNYSLEYRLKCKNGSWKWVLARGMVVEENVQGKPIRMVGTHTDISQLKESEEQVWQHANFDYLTNLPNRRMLYTRLEREIEKTKRFGSKLALLFLDLDGFKEINDTLGHDHGDVLLQQAAERLTSCTFAQDVVARLGGDEFIVMVPDVQHNAFTHIELVAQKVLSTLAQPFLLKHEKAFITASMGIVIYPDDASTIDGLMKCVDQAMYASKNRGGHCFTYYMPEMQESALNRLHLSNDLRLALEKKQLFVEYQPIVDLNTNEVYKSEALLRWRHPERGLIGPAEFIPVAEDTRLINEIGNWVFLEAIKQCKAWREKLDKRFQVAVNKSPVQFMTADAKHSSWIKKLPQKSSEENAIVVEITESLLLEASSQVEQKLNEYRAKGIEIALDDFGTGYSSLSYLRKFDIDYLKIDKSFVANLERSSEDQVLCKAIIDMAHSLSIKVIAEGIETNPQLEVLVKAGCDYGQGFYFSKPLSPTDFQRYMQRAN